MPAASLDGMQQEGRQTWSLGPLHHHVTLHAQMVCDHFFDTTRKAFKEYQKHFHEEKKNQKVQFSCSVVSDYLRPHESQHARHPCPSPTPGVHSDSRPLSR